jgi:hypothetical protein
VLLEKINYFLDSKDTIVSLHGKQVYLDNFIGLGKVTPELVEVMVKYDKRIIKILGNNLSIKRLSQNAMLLDGVVKNIEYR